MTEYIRRGDLADSVYNFSFRPHVEMEYEGDFDDLRDEIHDMHAIKDGIVALPSLGKSIRGLAFADTENQVGWMVFHRSGDVYDMERHYLSEMVNHDGYLACMWKMEGLREERDELMELTGEMVRVASSTEGMDLYRATTADGSPASYWLEHGDGKVTHLLTPYAIEAVLMHADHMTVNASAGNVWSMVAAMVSARQSYLEFDTDSDDGREFRCLANMDLRLVIHSLTKE
ncbi:MAG TPA: hypothetical protein VK054_13110 [Beutenbergiaceae bacterium]|nr:hypothetical protein [Beutenbergiaceae bacterium]